jgi:hypothetical protein
MNIKGTAIGAFILIIAVIGAIYNGSKYVKDTSIPGPDAKPLSATSASIAKESITALDLELISVIAIIAGLFIVCYGVFGDNNKSGLKDEQEREIP